MEKCGFAAAVGTAIDNNLYGGATCPMSVLRLDIT